MRKELILASKSPFRLQFLANAGIDAEICGADIDERAVEAEFLEESAAVSVGSVSAKKGYTARIGAKAAPLLAERLAQAKAKEVSRRFPDAVVIGCDQILEQNGKILHKVENMEAARRRLRELSGKTHKLHSAFAVVRGGAVLESYVDTAKMTMLPLPTEQIDMYLRHAEQDVLKSVGVYQIEGMGIRLFSDIQGDYWTIVGLPLLPLLCALRRLKVLES